MLSYLVGRPVRTVELAKALGVARSSYYAARDQGRLITADNLLRLAGELDVNPVGLLARYGFISELSVVEYAEELGEPRGTSKSEPKSEPLRARRDAPPL